MKYQNVLSAPDYLKVVEKTLKNGRVSKRFYVIKSDSTKDSKLYQSLGKHVETESEAKKEAKKIYEQWISESLKPKAAIEQELTAITFKDLGEEVIALKESQKIKTYVSAVGHIRNRLTPYFIIHCPYLRDFNETHWKQYVAYRKKLAPKGKLFNDVKHMRMMIIYALEKGVIKRKVKIYNPDPKTQAGKEFSDSEIHALFNAAKEQYQKDLMEIAFKQGLRRKELLSMKWDWIQFEAGKDKTGVVHIPETITKTKDGRHMPLNADVKGVLKRIKTTSESSFVFPSPSNVEKPMTDVKTFWGNVKRNAGVKGRWHDWRATCATRMLRAGHPQAFIGRHLGMSEQVLTRIYSKIQLEDKVSMANTIRGKFGKDLGSET